MSGKEINNSDLKNDSSPSSGKKENIPTDEDSDTILSVKKKSSDKEKTMKKIISPLLSYSSLKKSEHPCLFNLDILSPFRNDTRIYIYGSSKSGKSSLARTIINIIPSCHLLVFSNKPDDIYENRDNDIDNVKTEYYKGYDPSAFKKFIKEIHRRKETNIKPTFVIFDKVNDTSEKYKQMLKNNKVKKIMDNKNLQIIYIFIECSDYGDENGTQKTTPNLGFNIKFDYLFIGKNGINQGLSKKISPALFGTSNLNIINDYKGNFMLIDTETDNLFLYIGNNNIKEKYANKGDNYFLKSFKKRRSRSRSRSNVAEVQLSPRKPKRESKTLDLKSGLNPLKDDLKLPLSPFLSSEMNDLGLEQNVPVLELGSDSNIHKFKKLGDIFTPPILEKMHKVLEIMLDKYLDENKK